MSESGSDIPSSWAIPDIDGSFDEDMSTPPNFYVDFVNGSDSENATGSFTFPFRTVVQAGMAAMEDAEYSGSLSTRNRLVLRSDRGNFFVDFVNGSDSATGSVTDPFLTMRPAMEASGAPRAVGSTAMEAMGPHSTARWVVLRAWGDEMLSTTHSPPYQVPEANRDINRNIELSLVKHYQKILNWTGPDIEERFNKYKKDRPNFNVDRQFLFATPPPYYHKGEWMLSALIIAVKEKKLQIIELLLKNGADVNLKSNGNTALHYACLLNIGPEEPYSDIDEQIIKLLLVYGADTEDNNGHTPFSNPLFHPIYGKRTTKIQKFLYRPGQVRSGGSKSKKKKKSTKQRKHTKKKKRNIKKKKSSN